MNKLAFQYGIEKYCKDHGLDADDLAVLLKMAEKAGLEKEAWNWMDLLQGGATTFGRFFPPTAAAAGIASGAAAIGEYANDAYNKYQANKVHDQQLDDYVRRGIIDEATAAKAKAAKSYEERRAILNGGPNRKAAPVAGQPGAGQPGAAKPSQGGFGPGDDDPDNVIAQYQKTWGPYARKQNQGAMAMKFLELSDQMGLDPNDPASAPLALERFRARYGDMALTNLQNTAKQNKQWFQGYVDPSSVQIQKPTGRAPQLMAGGAGNRQAPTAGPASAAPAPASISTPPASGNYVPPPPSKLNAGDAGFTGYDAPAATPQMKGPKLSGQTSFGQPTLTSAALAQQQQGNGAATAPVAGNAAVKAPGLKNSLNNDAIGRQLMTGKPAWVNGQRIDPSSPEAAQYKAVFENSPSGKIYQQNQQSTGWRAASQQIADRNARARESGADVKQPGIYTNMETPNATGSLRNLDMDRVANKGNYRPTGQLPAMTGKPPVDTAAAKAMAKGQPAFTPATPAAPVTPSGGGDTIANAVKGNIAAVPKPKPTPGAYVDPETGRPPLDE